MNLRLWRTLVRCAWVLCLLSAWSVAAQTAPTRIMVKPRPGVNAKEMAGLHARYGGHLHRKYPQIGGWEVIALPAPLDVDAIVERYRASALVDSAEPDSLLRGLYTPNDPLFTEGTLWNLHNNGNGGGQPLCDMKRAIAHNENS